MFINDELDQNAIGRAVGEKLQSHFHRAEFEQMILELRQLHFALDRAAHFYDTLKEVLFRQINRVIEVAKEIERFQP